MGFIAKWVGGALKDLGLVDTPAAPAAPPPVPTMTTANTQPDMDLAAQNAARAMAGGKTSTMINGADGVDDTKNTSKVLLGR